MDAADIGRDAVLIAEILAHPQRAANLVIHAMQHLKELIAAQDKLIAARHAADERADAAEARAEAAEKHAADLEAQIAADEASASDALDRVSAEVTAETGGTTASQVDGVQFRPAAAAVLNAVPDAAPMHVEEAVSAHEEAIADGSTHEDAKVAAETAARDVGATPEQASAIAAAIPAPVGDGAVKADPPAVGGAIEDAPKGKTILADGTELKG